MTVIDNKKFVKDLFNAVYGYNSFVFLAGDSFIIPTEDFPYSKQVWSDLVELLGEPKGGNWILKIEDSKMAKLLFPPKTLKMSEHLVEAYMAGVDISLPTDMGIDIEYIYYADCVGAARAKYGLPVESHVLLARLLLKNMYSGINRQPAGDSRVIKSYRTNGYELTVTEFGIKALKGLISKDTRYELPNNFIKEAMGAKLRADMRGLLEKKPFMNDDKEFITLLQPYVYNYILKSNKAKTQISQALRHYSSQREKLERRENRESMKHWLEYGKRKKKTAEVQGGSAEEKSAVEV